MNQSILTNRSVLVTGHTGFEGGWMSLWRTCLGTKVHGYSLAPPAMANFFDVTGLESHITTSTIGDIRYLVKLTKAMRELKPTIVLHMAVQPLVLQSYRDPVDTHTTNVMGTLNVLEATRLTGTVEVVVNATTDKWYENREWVWPYREADRLGGHNPYSNSNACAEIITQAYRGSFLASDGIHVASARAGNVIGDGDWAQDRLIPDFFRAQESGEVLYARSPHAVRPWQHMLKPLSGFRILAEHLVTHGIEFAQAWNFGPTESDAKSVAWILDKMCARSRKTKWMTKDFTQSHEANLLRSDSLEANRFLSWKPRWSLETAIDKTIQWRYAWKIQQPMRAFSMCQIAEFKTS